MGRSYPLLHYQTVAEVYEEADQYGFKTPLNGSGTGKRTPTADVAATWNVPHSTAARWVKECRKRGLLPPPAPKCSSRCPVHCP